MGLTAAIVLAAGSGTRFLGGGHKLLVELRGTAVVRSAVDAALAAGLDHTIVVTGASPELGDVLPSGIERVDSPRAHEGLAHSLAAGIDAADRLGCDAVVVGLGDQPLVPPEAWRLLASADSPIAVATYDGVRGNPVRLAREVWPLLPVSGDEGARVVMRSRPDLVLEIPCPGSPADIDTVEDLDRWS